MRECIALEVEVRQRVDVVVAGAEDLLCRVSGEQLTQLIVDREFVLLGLRRAQDVLDRHSLLLLALFHCLGLNRTIAGQHLLSFMLFL